jgi:adenine phosphoribosyltransferase
MAGLVPAIHVFIPLKSWMPGTRLVLGPAEGRTRVPGMTAEKALLSRSWHLALMTSPELEKDLRAAIRNIPDYPWAGMKIDKVAGIEARGFILGGAVAHQVSAGFIPIRKKGKLPYKRVTIGYSLEYGIDEMEMHEDAVQKGERVILVDDLIATGGTAEAAVKLLRKLGANVLAACFVIDLPELGGADKLRKLQVPVRTLISFEGH